MDHAPSQSGFLFRLALIIDGVYRATAAHIARDRTAGPTIVVVCNDVRRRFFRFARLVALVQLGILPRTRLRRPDRAPRPASDGAPGLGASDGAKAAARVPGGRGALVKMMQQAPWTIAVYASQLNAWMADAAVESFLQSYPQGRRILRPIWRMLSLDPLPEPLREPGREPVEQAAGLDRALHAAQGEASGFSRDGGPCAPGPRPKERLHGTRRRRDRSIAGVPAAPDAALDLVPDNRMAPGTSDVAFRASGAMGGAAPRHRSPWGVERPGFGQDTLAVPWRWTSYG